MTLGRKQGCQIYINKTNQNDEKWTQLPQNIPNGHKIYQMATKYTKMAKKYTKLSINSPNEHKIYQRLPLQGPSKY
jgi:hypothetical protein